MARSTFYYHLKQLKFPDKYKQEKNEIVSIYHVQANGFAAYNKTVSKMTSLVSAGAGWTAGKAWAGAKGAGSAAWSGGKAVGRGIMNGARLIFRK